jgi:hypothetical protein
VNARRKQKIARRTHANAQSKQQRPNMNCDKNSPHTKTKTDIEKNGTFNQHNVEKQTSENYWAIMGSLTVWSWSQG